MKNTTKKQKIALVILAIIIIYSLVVLLTEGFNFELKMQETKKIELYLQNNFEISDIKNIVKEVIPEQNEVMPEQEVIVQKVELFEDSVRIIAKDITEEQKQHLIEKVNEKYGTEISADSIEITTIPNIKVRDLIKPYILPFVISSVLVLAYMAIKYRKLGSLKTILKVVLTIIASLAILVSAILISRFPIGRLIMPMVIIVYLLTLIAITTRLERQLKNKNEEDNKKSKQA